MLKCLTIAQIHAIIEQAEKLNLKHPPSDIGIRAGSDEAKDRVLQYETDGKPLKREIGRLDHDARMELMALVWVGRGDGDFESCLEHARQNTDEGDVPYIAEKAMSLPTYLRNGLKKIGAEAT